MKDPLSLILLPTLNCNADCDYCFEAKSDHQLSLAGLSELVEKVLDYADQHAIGSLICHWQGGEVMLLGPDWFEKAHHSIRLAEQSRNIRIRHFLQSNLIAYHPGWNDILFEMFDGVVGSSVDIPNRHRRLRSGRPEEFSSLWTRKLEQANTAGLRVEVISIPNPGTLRMGGAEFYARLVDEMGVTSFQINTPFPGGASNAVKQGFPLDTEDLGRFLLDLADHWLEHGAGQGIQAGPFDALLELFSGGDSAIPCIWQPNCGDEFICIDPRGHVSQCDCWVTSYSDFRFGNIFEDVSLAELLASSQARRRLMRRPVELIATQDCIDCDYLAFCHGGCPVRAYSSTGVLNRKDPYCRTYRKLFQHLRDVATLK